MRLSREGTETRGPVLYWMSRSQRADHNWSLLYAQHDAIQKRSPLIVVFCLQKQFLGATLRQYDFMLKGLEQTAHTLESLNIPFIILYGSPDQNLPAFIRKHHISALYYDQDPLRIKEVWIKALLPQLNIPAYEVDSSNCVPVWLASPKQEYGAYTFRPRIKRLLDDYLCPYPDVQTHPYSLDTRMARPPWTSLDAELHIDRTVQAQSKILPGADQAHEALKRFLEEKLTLYSQYSNDPNRDAVSRLSAYLHFGQISAQEIALEIRQSGLSSADSEAFLEQLIVRRELSDNYCFYNRDYDSLDRLPAWARQTLEEHRPDPRAYLYTPEQWEQARTHDPLWNAAQQQLLKSGYMHGYMRMYWAKKILEWSASPEEAMETAIRLNDKYQLDGRDPNGYTGIAWSIGGIHDRAWPSHPVYGKIRYMNSNGCKRKFDVEKYIKTWL